MVPETLTARECIRHTMEMSVMNADSGNYAGNRELFHHEALLEVPGMPKVQGVDAIISLLEQGAQKRRAFADGNFQRHNLTTIMIDFPSPDRAHVTTYFLIISELGLDSAGRYDDEFIKAGERWLIARRRANVDWVRPDSRFAARAVVSDGPPQ